MAFDDDNPFAPGDGAAASPVPMDVTEILGRCWDVFKSNPGIVLGAVLLPMIPAMGFGMFGAALEIGAEATDDDMVALALSLGRLGTTLLSSVIGVFFQLGMIRIFLQLVRGQPAELGMLVGEGMKFPSALVASILMGIAVLTGFLLLIVPGIVVALGLQFTLYALVDRDLNPFDAMKESWRLTDGYKLTVFLVNLVIGAFGLVATCVTCGFGYVLILPVLSLVQAVMYQSLQHLQDGRA